MPKRLVGARVRMRERINKRNTVGRFKFCDGENLVLEFEDITDPPVSGVIDGVCFANASEITFQLTTLQSDKKKAVVRVISEFKEWPMSKTLRILSEEVPAECHLGGQTIGITLVAVAPDGFAFEAKDVMPMDESAKFYMLDGDRPIPLDAEIILQRFTSGGVRAMCRLGSLDRIAEMHWHRLLKTG